MVETSDPRRQIKTPFGPCQELALKHFLDHVLPPLRHGLDPVRIVATMKSSGKSSSNKIITSNNRWRGFARDPADGEQSTYDTFKHLEAVVKAIVKVASTDSGNVIPSSNFWSNPDPVSTCWSWSGDRLPNATFRRSPEHGWENVAVCGEYQKGEDSDCAQDIIAKVTDSMANCVHHDLRRRFVFGFTIENTDTRLWFCDRSRFMTSEPFNFITDHSTWVHFCLSILYAEPHQLGWDTTMKPLPDGRNFDISVRSADGQTRTYRTQSMLSGINPGYRLGKGTRVWKAVHVDDGEESGPPVALKDYWVHPDYAREGDIIQSIGQDALALKDELLVKRNLLTVECHGDVFIGDNSDEAAVDCTRTFTTDETSEDSTSQIFRRRLVHYRLVVHPAGEQCIEHEASLKVIFHALAHAAGSLQLMHRVGWVHRDVSIGNILVGDSPCLVDFEYAKRALDEDDFNIGTLFFKALEVDTKSFRYTPPLEKGPERAVGVHELRDLADTILEMLRKDKTQTATNSQRRQTGAVEIPEDAEGKILLLPPVPTPPPEIPLRYNPLHDLESLWWVAVYFLFKREVLSQVPDGEPPNGRGVTNWDREKQRKSAGAIFHNSDSRYLIIMRNSGYFHQEFLPVVQPAMAPVGSILEDLRNDLVDRYLEVEKDPASIDFTCAEGLYERFIAGFSKIQHHPQLKDLLLVPLVSPPDPNPRPPVNATPAPSKASQPKSQLDPEDRVQVVKKETKKGPKANRRPKPATEIPGHRYNLRPHRERR